MATDAANEIVPSTGVKCFKFVITMSDGKLLTAAVGFGWEVREFVIELGDGSADRLTVLTMFEFKTSSNLLLPEVVGCSVDEVLFLLRPYTL